MTIRLYIGNLPEVNPHELKDLKYLFDNIHNVLIIKLIKYRRTFKYSAFVAFVKVSTVDWNKWVDVLLKLKCYQEAIRICDEILKLQKDNYLAWLNRGCALTDLRFYEDALYSFEQAYSQALIIQSDENIWQSRRLELYGLFNLSRYETVMTIIYETASWDKGGDVLLKLKCYQAAIKICDKILKLQKDNYLAWLDQGYELNRQKLYEDALYSFEQAYRQALIIQSDENIWQSRSLTLSTLFNLSRYETVITICETAPLQLMYHDPTKYIFSLALSKYSNELIKKNRNTEAIVNLCKSSFLLLELGQYQEALKNLNKVIEINKYNYEAWYYKGKALLKYGQSIPNSISNLIFYEEAITCFKKAFEIRQDCYETWYDLSKVLINCGKVIAKLKDWQNVIACFKQSLKIKIEYYEAGFSQCEGLIQFGIAIAELGDWQKALSKFDEALRVLPNSSQAWNYRGLALQNLGDWEEALCCFDKAVKNDINYDQAWINRNEALEQVSRLKLYKTIIASCEDIIKFKENDYHSWFYWGFALFNINQYEDAILCYDKSLKIKDSNTEAWYERGQALLHLEYYQEAFHSYEEALNLNTNYQLAWNGKGNALRSLGKELGQSEYYYQAIDAFSNSLKLSENHYWRSWRNMGLAYQYLSNYRMALECWKNGLKYIQQEDEDWQEGCGLLNYSKGICEYQQGQVQRNYSYRIEAKKSYKEALIFLTKSDFPNWHFKVLEDLVVVIEELITDYRGLGDTKTANSLLDEGTEILYQWINNINNENQQEKIDIERRFASFNQLLVDRLVESNKPENYIKALEKAEERKNLCLRWLRTNQWTPTETDSPKYKIIQQIIPPQTAVLYWHISPATITIFILKYNHKHPIVIINNKIAEFQTWMTEWKQNYSSYRRNKENSRIQPQEHLWRQSLALRLQHLASNILDISNIVNYLSEDIEQLVFIPHRDLYLLPLHYLFLQEKEFIISYLPNAKIAYRGQKYKSNINQGVLIVENFYTERFTKIIKPHPTKKWHLVKYSLRENPLLFSQIESSIISKLYQPHCQQLLSVQATKENVKEALKTAVIFLFTGHGFHNFNSPRKSELSLKGGTLTLEDILKLKLHNYYLVCLSACESGITSTDNLIDEFVGLASGFLAVGVNYVISTLWTVDDICSALLMIKFHVFLKEGSTPAAALARAQKWLKTLTKLALAEYYRQLADELPDFDSGKLYLKASISNIQKDFATIRPNDCPYEDPYYWAGFTINGKIDTLST